jgi:hypothetical protein
MAKITHRYDLPDYAAFMNMGFDLKLADDVLKSVSELADLVGAPTYVKTPVFPVRSELGSSAGTGTSDAAGATTGYHIAGSSANTFQSRIGSNGDTFITRQSSSSSSSHGGSGTGGATITRQRNASQQIPNSEWETILAFQKTEIQKKEGIELSIDNIRSYLNKLTDKTYTAMLSNILKEIAALFTASTDDKSDEHNTVAVMNRIASSIFTTASSNSFYSEIYARLFRDLMAEYAVFREVFEKNLASFMSLFETIEYCDPKKNYDKFCDINKANEKRKAMSLFIVNLMKNGIVEKTHVLAIMRQIQELMYTNMRQEGKTNEVDELAENLYIMVKHSHSVLKTASSSSSSSSSSADAEVAELFAQRLEQIVEISKLKIKSKPSITNKTIFKHLDMLDEISGKSKK